MALEERKHSLSLVGRFLLHRRPDTCRKSKKSREDGGPTLVSLARNCKPRKCIFGPGDIRWFVCLPPTQTKRRGGGEAGEAEAGRRRKSRGGEEGEGRRKEQIANKITNCWWMAETELKPISCVRICDFMLIKHCFLIHTLEQYNSATLRFNK